MKLKMIEKYCRLKEDFTRVSLIKFLIRVVSPRSIVSPVGIYLHEILQALFSFWKHKRILVKKTRCLPHWNCFIIMRYGYCLKGAILSERRHGLPGRSLYSYMANVKSVVLIIGRGYTMRTRLRRDKLCTPIWVRIECDTASRGRTRGPLTALIITSNVCRIVSLIIPI